MADAADSPAHEDVEPVLEEGVEAAVTWERSDTDTADSCCLAGNEFFKASQFEPAEKCYSEAMKLLLHKDDPDVRPRTAVCVCTRRWEGGWDPSPCAGILVRLDCLTRGTPCGHRCGSAAT